MAAMGFGRFQLLMTLFAGAAFLADAMEIMLLSFIGPEVHCQWDVSGLQEATLTSVVFVGMMVGSQVWGAVADTHGRKTAFLASVVFTSVFAVATALAPNYAALVALRTLSGVGMGGFHVPFTLLAEFIPPGMRGQILMTTIFFWTVGTMLEGALAWAILGHESGSWRLLVAVSAVPMLFMLAAAPFVPESPHFLLARGETEKVEAILAHMSRVNGRSLPAGKLEADGCRAGAVRGPGEGGHSVLVGATPGAYSVVEEDGRWGAEGPGAGGGLRGWAERRRGDLDQALAVSRPPYRGMLLVLMTVWTACALTYYGVVLLVTELHASVGECVGDRSSLTGEDLRDIFITTLAELPGILLAYLTVEPVGRLPLLGGGMGLTGLFLTVAVLPLRRGGLLAMLFMARLFVLATFQIAWIYTPEALPTGVRAVGMGVCSGCARLGGVLSPVLSVALVQGGARTAAVSLFALACALAALAATRLPFETRGRGLPEEGDGTSYALRPVLWFWRGAGGAGSPVRAGLDGAAEGEEGGGGGDEGGGGEGGGGAGWGR